MSPVFAHAQLRDWPTLYPSVRDYVADQYAGEIEWAQTVKVPTDPDHMALEYTWVVLNSGMKWKIARRIYDERVEPALKGRGCVWPAEFGHDGKRDAINGMWAARQRRFAEMHAEFARGADAALAWCVSLPWIGDITKYHLAKNYGVDCAKPDRHLERIAAAAGTDTHTLCRVIHEQHGDRIATVDYVIWRAAEMGLL